MSYILILSQVVDLGTVFEDGNVLWPLTQRDHHWTAGHHLSRTPDGEKHWITTLISNFSVLDQMYHKYCT